MAILIIGGDSKLSKVLLNQINDDEKIYKTTRRKITTDNQFFLDFSEINNFIIPSDIDKAVIIGGVTNYDECSKKYEYAYNINCRNIPLLIKKLLKQDIYTCFISTNTVFKFLKNLPTEKDKPCPAFSYAMLKAETEKEITKISLELDKQKYLSILRLTKNISKDTSPFDNWISQINKSKTFNAFSDLYFSPITFYDSALVIKKILNKKLPGIFHLSGEKDISYSDFALKLVSYLNLNENIVSVIKSEEIGVKLIYNHHITALNMDITSSLLDVYPIPLINVLKYFKSLI